MIRNMSWMDVEAYLQRDDRAVVPLGSTEQHAYLSLEVDNVLSTRVATEAAEPLGVPVFPTVNYGLTPYFTAYPGTVTLRVDTYVRVIRDILDSLEGSGFRRVLLVNGHGGNAVAHGFVIEWMRDHPGVRVKWHNWWNAPRTLAKVREIEPEASHASWMESFPWTRLGSASPGSRPERTTLPEGAKDPVDLDRMRLMSPEQVRSYLGDGNMGGSYAKPDELSLEVWRIGVEETRSALEAPWE